MPPGFLSSQHWGLPLPGAEPPWDTGKCSWEVTTEALPFGSQSLRLRHRLLLDVDYSSRCSVTENGFWWDVNSDSILKAT